MTDDNTHEMDLGYLRDNPDTSAFLRPFSDIEMAEAGKPADAPRPLFLVVRDEVPTYQTILLLDVPNEWSADLRVPVTGTAEALEASRWVEGWGAFVVSKMLAAASVLPPQGANAEPSAPE